MKNRYPFQPKAVLWHKGKPTMRAADGGWAARFSGVFVALGFFRFDGASQPSPTAATDNLQCQGLEK